MKKQTKMMLSLVFLILSLGIVSEIKAQKVPANIRARLVKDLADTGCDKSNITIKSQKVGPNKAGYSAICNYGFGIFYEKVGSEVIKIFEESGGMNGEVQRSNKVYKGYYEIAVIGRTSDTVSGWSYRWNGQKFVCYSCEETNVTTNKSKRCKC
jgi:hypothetical protein